MEFSVIRGTRIDDTVYVVNFIYNPRINYTYIYYRSSNSDFRRCVEGNIQMAKTKFAVRL